MKRLVFLFCAVCVFPAGLFAAPPDEKAKQMIEKKFEAFAPGLRIDSIEYAPIEGFYEVLVGSRIIYFTQDGNHMFLGELLDTNTRENLTENRRALLTAAKLEKYGKDQMLVIGPPDAKRYVTVFTDVDCPYCAKFHRDVPALNAAGIEVRYLLFPRTGIGSRSYKRAVGVWCAEDPIESVGIAKAGGEVAFKDCDNPVEKHYALGQEVGINGTPAIILDDGRMIAGYIPPQRLMGELGMAGQQ